MRLSEQQFGVLAPAGSLPARETGISAAMPTWVNGPRIAVALLLAIVVIYPEVVLGTHTFVFRDFSIFSYPNALYHRQSFWRGEIPLWNPLSNCGIPFLAQWNTMTLYPLSLIYLLLPMPWSLNIFCLLHLFIGAMGMFYLTSHWTGNRLAGAAAGISFGFCGLMLVSLIWPNIVAVLGWMPWVILTSEQGCKEGGTKFWIAVLVATLQMLAGMPEYTLLTWVIIVGLCAAQKTKWQAWRRLAVTVVIVSGLASAQLLPFFQLLAESKRNVLFDAGEWSLPLWGWANFLVPLFHTRAVPQGVYFQADQPLFTSYYVAIPILLLAVYATLLVRDRRVWLLAATGLLGFWLALGKAGYLYKWLLECSPFLGFMRYPTKFIALPVVVLPLLGGFGISHWMNSDAADASKARRTMIVLAVICGLVVSGVVVYAQLRPLPEHDGPPVLWNGLWRALFLVLAAGSLWFLRKLDRPTIATWASIAFLVCVLMDSLTQVPKHYPTAPAHVFDKGAITARLSDPPRPERSRAMIGRATHDFLYYGMLPDAFNDVIGRRVGLLGNLNLIENIATPDGFYAMYLPPSRHIWTAMFFAAPHRFPNGLADFTAVSHITSVSNILEWTARSNAMTLASAGQEPRFADEKSVLQRLVDPSFDPRKVVYLPVEAERSTKVKKSGTGQISGQSFRSNEVVLDVEATEPTLVVIAQSDYSPWRAFVDGTRTKIWRANYAFQAVEVPGGRHKVRIVYQDRAFQFGAGVSLLTVCACGIGWRRAKRLQRKLESAAPAIQR